MFWLMYLLFGINDIFHVIGLIECPSCPYFIHLAILYDVCFRVPIDPGQVLFKRICHLMSDPSNARFLCFYIMTADSDAYMVSTEEADNKHRARSEKTQELRRLILEVSVDLFLEQGYDKTTTRQIIERAGILNGSLYNLFKTKEEIFSAAISEGIWKVMNGTQPAISASSTLMTLGFPMLFPIYVASRSKPLAELMAMAGKNWDSMNRICDSMTAWIKENDRHGLFDTDAPDFHMKMCACLGAQANVVDLYARTTEVFDVVQVMIFAANIMLNIFDIPHHHLEEKVSALYDYMSGREFSIYGIRI